ncbi:MAG: hypothetical protein JSV51_01690 [Candidatus Bathyarchaeota archaeon]|nr:MAG: hypothetical protein JSV51_01690 [Candidatus Bathyarchaeota archaeon]
MSEVKTCLKCKGEMKTGDMVSYGGVRLIKPGDIRGDAVRAYYCIQCGYIELYKDPSSKEPWRKKRR